MTFRHSSVLLLCFLVSALLFSKLDSGELPDEGVRLSFYGYQSTPLGFFDEAVTDSLRLWIRGTLGPIFQGSPHYFGFLSKGHGNLGYNLPDTRVDCPEFPCTNCNYRIVAKFVGPGGELIIGGVDACCDQNAQVAGNQWQGFVPDDFTHLRVDVDAHEPLMICPKTFLLPLVWAEDPLPVERSTWGGLKSRYEH